MTPDHLAELIAAALGDGERLRVLLSDLRARAVSAAERTHVERVIRDAQRAGFLRGGS